jgi:hypothetical protein
MDLFWTKDGDEYAFSYDKLQEAIGWVHDQFRQALDDDSPESSPLVVVDNVSYDPAHYAFFKDYAEEQGCRVHIVHIERPVEDCIVSTKHGVPADKIRTMAKNWVPV